jgi:hypothetical protein
LLTVLLPHVTQPTAARFVVLTAAALLPTGLCAEGVFPQTDADVDVAKLSPEVRARIRQLNFISRAQNGRDAFDRPIALPTYFFATDTR